MSSLLVLTATSQNYNGKVLKILKTFLSRPRPKTKTLGPKTKTKTLVSVLEAPRDQDHGLEDYITDNYTR